MRKTLEEKYRAAIENYGTKLVEETFKEEGNYLISPLSSWILLAVLVASVDFSGAPESKEKLEELLGLNQDEAGVAVQILIEELEQAKGVEVTQGVWFKESNSTLFPRISGWLDQDKLTEHVTGVPSQEWLDEWTSDKTHGLIQKFPIEVDPKLVTLLLANVLYLKTAWFQKFKVISTDNVLGKSWLVSNILEDTNTEVKVYQTDEYGKLYLHRKAGESGIIIYSGIIDEPINSKDLLNLTKKAIFEGLEEKPLEELTDNARVSIKTSIATAPVVNVKMPAWKADLKVELSEGYNELAEVFSLDRPKGEAPLEVKSSQACVANFTKEGFEAAAVTAVGFLRASAVWTPPEEQPEYNIQFNDSYAVVAVQYPLNVPLFEGIVREASEA